MENKKYSKSLFTFVYFIFVAMVVFGLGFFIVDRITVNRPSMISYYCYELDGWEQIRGDQRIPLNMPDEFELEKGEPLIMETKLPDTIYGDTWIDYYSGKHFVMYIDGEQRYEHPSPGQYTVPGGIVKTLHVYMPVFPDDAGKTIRLVRSGEEDNGGKILEIYIGTALGLVERIITKNIKHFVLAVSLMVIAVISIMVGVILKVTHKGNPNISSVGVGVFFVALWLILDSELFQFAFRDYYIDGTISFIVSLLIPLPFLYYLDTLQKDTGDCRGFDHRGYGGRTGYRYKEKVLQTIPPQFYRSLWICFFMYDRAFAHIHRRRQNRRRCAHLGTVFSSYNGCIPGNLLYP